LSLNCRARVTVENDDRASMFSVADLKYLADKTRIPIVL
jgi:UV DNA damage endonuclease